MVKIQRQQHATEQEHLGKFDRVQEIRLWDPQENDSWLERIAREDEVGHVTEHASKNSALKKIETKAEAGCKGQN